MAAIPEFRRPILHVSAPARRQSRRGLGYPYGPHPRFYADRTGTVPIAVPALVRNWWPMLFFMVFKSPSEGRTHILVLASRWHRSSWFQKRIISISPI